MRTVVLALLGTVLCLPSMGAEKEKPLPKDIPSLKALADKGDAKAQFDLGLKHTIGEGVEKDFKEAAKWYRKSAEQNSSSAQYSLGLMYATGRGVEKDEKEAVKWYQKAADQGDAIGQYNLGWMYNVGRGVEENAKEAVKWYRKAAEQGNAQAQFALGLLYAYGKGIKKDEKKAIEWFTKAAEQGDAGAQNNLGVFYQKGQWVEKNAKEAVKWYRKSAEQNSSSAQYSLGLMYATGRGVEKDEKEAAKWYRKAAEQGDAHGQYRLGLIYHFGQGVEKDDKEAVKWFTKAAEQNSSAAQYKLGVMYRYGQGVERNAKEAVKWCTKSAEQNNPQAQFLLGMMYRHGEGVANDLKEAAKWYRKAAEQGFAEAQYNLGYMYHFGQGVECDFKEAVKWVRKAAEQGFAEAQLNLGWMIAQEQGSVQKGYVPRRDSLPSARRSRVLPSTRDSAYQRSSYSSRAALLTRASARQRSSPSSSRAALLQRPVQKRRYIPRQDTPKGRATGFFITDDGYILTNHHVVEWATHIQIKTENGKLLPAKVVRSDKKSDLAVLKVDGKFAALPLIQSREVSLGESVFTVGFPRISELGHSPKLTTGRINSLAGYKDDPRRFQTSVPVHPGSSGGPLVDEYGNVVGVMKNRIPTTDRESLEKTGYVYPQVNYAVKSSYAIALFESLPNVSSKLKAPVPRDKERKFTAVVKEVLAAKVLIEVWGTPTSKTDVSRVEKVTRFQGRRTYPQQTKTDVSRAEKVTNSPKNRAQKDNGHCPVGHELTEFRTPNSHYYCNICWDSQRLGARMFRCRVCEWDKDQSFWGLIFPDLNLDFHKCEICAQPKAAAEAKAFVIPPPVIQRRTFKPRPMRYGRHWIVGASED